MKRWKNFFALLFFFGGGILFGPLSGGCNCNDHPGQESDQEQVLPEAGLESAYEPVPDSGQEFGQETTREGDQEPGQEAVQKDGQEFGQEADQNIDGDKKKRTDTFNPYPRPVDILFVVDNSGSMTQEQEKLANSFDKFITELMQNQIHDYQIGVITTDMGNCTQGCGRLRGTPKILTNKMNAQQLISAFAKNVNVSSQSSRFERGLDAVRAALSRPLIDDPNANKGFLRPGVPLVVIFVTDENDCSHNGAIDENLHSSVCNIPSSEMFLGPDGKPRLDSKGNPIKGQMDKLVPIAEYISFLKGLARPVIITGIIGDPMVWISDPQNPAQKKLVDPPGGCKKDQECQVGALSHKCMYLTSQQKRCGGCNSSDARATPGFRYQELIEAFSGPNNWFSICASEQEFARALLNTSGLIVDVVNYLVLSHPPALGTLQVEIIPPKGTPVSVPRANALAGKSCHVAECNGDFVCGPDNKCYGDGWIYFSPATNLLGYARLKLSGRYKKMIVSGSKVKATYTSP